jgi:ribulose-5-phosphate 4-epimerase/fuculose-1-phosphate aldolase
MNAQLTDLEQLDILAKACRILARHGHNDFTLGHLSWRTEDGQGFWMKRNAIGLSEVRDSDDFVLMDFDGRKVRGSGQNHSEWPIHSEIYQARADVAAVSHTHPFYGCVMSGLDEAPDPYTLAVDYFTAVPRFHDDAALIQTKQQGRALAQSLGPHFVVSMANHGVTCCGRSIEQMVCNAIFYEQACKAHLTGRASGRTASPIEPAVRKIRHGQVMTDSHIEQTWKFLLREEADGRDTPMRQNIGGYD